MEVGRGLQFERSGGVRRRVRLFPVRLFQRCGPADEENYLPVPDKKLFEEKQGDARDYAAHAEGVEHAGLL